MILQVVLSLAAFHPAHGGPVSAQADSWFADWASKI